MDADAIRMLIPVMALAIPVVGIVFHGLTQIAKERAKGAQGGNEELRGRLDAVEDELGRLHEENRALREDLMETQERLDFTERLLSQPKESSDR